MAGLPQVREYLIDIGSDMVVPSNQRMPTDDQIFLLYFIMGTYFGPDLKGENQQKSVFQRRAEGLPAYTPKKLAGSTIKTIEVERVYFYVLRKADQSLVLNLSWLHQFFHGKLSTFNKTRTLDFPQFDDLFPPHLHPHSMFEGQYEVIYNVLFINDPKIFYIGPEYLERFKRLTRLEDLRLEKDDAKLHTSVDGKVLYNIDVHEIEFCEEIRPKHFSGSKETRPSSPRSKPKDMPIKSGSTDCLPTEIKTSVLKELGSELVFLPSRPTREEWIDILTATKNGCALTGSAAAGQIGRSFGLVDIGECEDSYLFRVSLPGVKRDEREFSVEVGDDGKVSIRGVTVTGEKTVYRYKQTFEMQTQKLCPPGHFSISFKLPGPVDPQQFSGNFGTDGILEGTVMKSRENAKIS